MTYQFGPNAVRTGRLQIVSKKPAWDDDYETIERKGIGHPDSIADELATRISRNYSSYTYKQCDGLILHHQIDKLVVIGGREKVYFGGGNIIEPIQVLVIGRATYQYRDENIPVDAIIRQTVKDFFQSNYPMLAVDRDIVIENRLTTSAGPGTITTSAGAIARMFNPRGKEEVRGYEKYVANDTSCCVSYFPYSPLEKAVLELTSLLDAKDIKAEHPWLGSDIKVMAVRNGAIVDLTICVPQISIFVPTLNQYWRNLHTIGTLVDTFFKSHLPQYTFEISINTKDDYERFNVYMTFTGSSLAGDIGAVGRGNRVNGLITSNRPMSIEATPGKNPRYYSGFIYAILAQRLTREIYEHLGEASIVEIVSQNGAALQEPWRTRIVCAGDDPAIRHIYQRALADTQQMTLDFLKMR